ncbi:hypothetical protein AURDEDRAFT_154732 [Auricularia subglabra TFB-10046 SS5]|uniref:Uncharacterized protein n=1 Tax=Auricularia subglabra (strain TFB-10046 / SS5) TaxID=717982 RepID=J0WTR6_AURST|nr:hypothetical protein AURDEDRAFT_154732 [Auricularia subglabra TFB-10046 SS5]
MALQPSLHPLLILGSPTAPHTLDFFLDFVCPFSKKSALNAINGVLRGKLLAPGGPYDGKVKVILRLQVQPWHVTSMLTHESALAVLRLAPERFWDYATALFEHQDEYFDIPTADLTPTQIRAKLAALAASVIGQDKEAAVLDLLALKGSPNGGNAVTDDLKYLIKFSRQNSIHVSPTVLLNGLVANEISSSWGEKEWTDFLAQKAAL